MAESDDLQAKFEEAARQKGCIDPELAFLAVGERVSLQNGKLLGVDEALKQLRSERDYLFLPPGPLGSGGGNKNSNFRVSPGQALMEWFRGHR